MVDSLFTPAARRIADAIVQMRKDAGLTQRELAQKLGREQSYIGRIETQQRRVDLVELVAICRACGVDIESQILTLTRQLQQLIPAKGRR